MKCVATGGQTAEIGDVVPRGLLPVCIRACISSEHLLATSSPCPLRSIFKSKAISAVRTSSISIHYMLASWRAAGNIHCLTVSTTSTYYVHVFSTFLSVYSGKVPQSGGMRFTLDVNNAQLRTSVSNSLCCLDMLALSTESRIVFNLTAHRRYNEFHKTAFSNSILK